MTDTKTLNAQHSEDLALLTTLKAKADAATAAGYAKLYGVTDPEVGRAIMADADGYRGLQLELEQQLLRKVGRMTHDIGYTKSGEARIRQTSGWKSGR